VSTDLGAGEVHALVGENGAGKSTLIKILSGYLRPDSGYVTVSGRPLAPGDVAASERAGIAVIHQESTDFPDLGIVDNVFAGRERRRALGLALDRRRMRRVCVELLDRLGVKLDLDRPVGGLSPAQRQLVAVARALSCDSRMLIMDEPTSSLSGREVERLFAIVRQLRASGVGILYVSHNLDEVFSLADRVTVLRDGRWVETRPIGEVTRDGLVRSMVGRELSATGDVSEGRRKPGPARLEVKRLTRRPAFEDVSFAVHGGEILGLAGLVGAGRSEVARAIFGIDPPGSGKVLVSGRPIAPASVGASMQAGIALVPEDRQHQGLVLALSVRDNLVMAIRRKLTRWGLISPSRERAVADRIVADLSVRAASTAAPAESLSGGNQQKLVLGKWLATRPDVLILDEPTRGIDVGAKHEIHELIRGLAAGGSAVLLISSDLPELLSLGDRIVVMRAGRIAGELGRDEASQERVLALALAGGEAEVPA
jgi:rhamnose transport system ATP-binding protein